MSTMKHDITEIYDTKSQAERAGQQYQEHFGYTYKVKPTADGRWQMDAHTDQNLMG